MGKIIRYGIGSYFADTYSTERVSVWCRGHSPYSSSRATSSFCGVRRQLCRSVETAPAVKYFEHRAPDPQADHEWKVTFFFPFFFGTASQKCGMLRHCISSLSVFLTILHQVSLASPCSYCFTAFISVSYVDVLFSIPGWRYEYSTGAAIG